MNGYRFKGFYWNQRFKYFKQRTIGINENHPFRNCCRARKTKVLYFFSPGLRLVCPWRDVTRCQEQNEWDQNTVDLETYITICALNKEIKYSLCSIFFIFSPQASAVTLDFTYVLIWGFPGEFSDKSSVQEVSCFFSKSFRMNPFLHTVQAYGFNVEWMNACFL